MNQIIQMQLHKGFVLITKKKPTMLKGIWLQIAGGRSSDAVKIMDSFFTVCSLKYARKLISHAMLHFPIIISPFIPVLCSAELCSNVCSGQVQAIGSSSLAQHSLIYNPNSEERNSFENAGVVVEFSMNNFTITFKLGRQLQQQQQLCYGRGQMRCTI